MSRGYYADKYHEIVKFRRVWLKFLNVFLKETGIKKFMLYTLKILKRVVG